MHAATFAVLAVVTGCAHDVGDGRRELTRARIAAARGDRGKAISLYQRVPRFSMAWPRALFEEGRELVQRREHSRALGLFMTLKAPQLEEWVFPEAFALEAEVYWSNCYYGRARAIAKQFRDRVLPLRERAMELVSGAAIGSEHRWIASRLRGAEDAAERWERVDELVVEIDLAEAALAKIEAAIGDVKTMDNDLLPRLETTTIYSDVEQHRYEFDGEWWPDELANYRVFISSRCVRRPNALQTPEPAKMTVVSRPEKSISVASYGHGWGRPDSVTRRIQSGGGIRRTAMGDSDRH